jgi:hypothetical protein
VVRTDPFVLHVRGKASAAPSSASAPSAADAKPLKLLTSIFAPRKRHSDGHSFYTTDDVVGRAFKIDWSRAVSSRFRHFVAKEVPTASRAAGHATAERRAAADPPCSWNRGGLTWQDDGGLLQADEELSEIAEVLHKYARVVYTTYDYYCGSFSPLDDDNHCMNKATFFKFAVRGWLSIPRPPGCAPPPPSL